MKAEKSIRMLESPWLIAALWIGMALLPSMISIRVGISEDFPVVIEIVDKPERIEAFLPDLDQLIEDGLVTLQDVPAVFYWRNGNKNSDRK